MRDLFHGVAGHSPLDQEAVRLAAHMLQSWNPLGLWADRFDPIENAPEE